jgi:hypothetical protein
LRCKSPARPESMYHNTPELGLARPVSVGVIQA